MESQIFATALNINKTIMRHTVIYQRSKIIEDHESSMRKKQKRGVPIYLAADVSVESINIRREWDGISKALKREKKTLPIRNTVSRQEPLVKQLCHCLGHLPFMLE